jgi:very-short-patch-repair endonuclease
MPDAPPPPLPPPPPPSDRDREDRVQSGSRDGSGRDLPRHGEYRAKIRSVEAIGRIILGLEARGRTVNADRVAAWVASQQLALIEVQQLYVCGIGRNAVTRRIRSGLLHRVHQGVYLFGAPIFLPGARELAAVLACGESAVVNDRSAVALWRIAVGYDGAAHVAVVRGGGRSRTEINIHRVTKLDPRDVTTLRGIPIVTPARAILDLAADATGDELERAIAEAYALRLTTEAELRRVIQRNPLKAGIAVLRVELQREGGPAWTRREAERRMKLLLRKANMPRALTNHTVAGYPADFLFPAHRVIVEVDGYQFHSSRWAFERDRKRDAAHALAGYTVIRITWRQLTEEPFAVVAIVAAALQGGRVRD